MVILTIAFVNVMHVKYIATIEIFPYNDPCHASLQKSWVDLT